MIPNNIWIADTTKEAYTTYGLARPVYLSMRPHELELGPKALNASDGDIAAAWWLFEYNPSDHFVYASKYNEATKSFDVEQAIFQDTDGISRLAATFDQLGRPLVFYESGAELRLYWFDPVAAENALTYIADGSSPFATFDIRWDTTNANSDALLFYVRDNAIYYRVQRDRYSIEYATPVTSGAKELLQADMTEGYRLQLVYSKL